MNPAAMSTQDHSTRITFGPSSSCGNRASSAGLSVGNGGIGTEVDTEVETEAVDIFADVVKNKFRDGTRTSQKIRLLVHSITAAAVEEEET
jgi:hypothetical protein